MSFFRRDLGICGVLVHVGGNLEPSPGPYRGMTVILKKGKDTVENNFV
jgi:hypothetical protein